MSNITKSSDCDGQLMLANAKNTIHIAAAIDSYNEEEHYKKQIEELAEKELLLAPQNIEFLEVNPVRVTHEVKWTLEEVVAGSSVARLISNKVISNDIDVYFKSIDTAMLWARMNKVDNQVRWNLRKQKDQLNVCAWVTLCGSRYNLIWGVKYNDAKDLISGFDIRACAVAIDVGFSKMFCVKGAIQDINCKRIVWQTTAKNISVNRLTKYIKKGFTIDGYQRAMFVELLKSGIYDVDLELSTGYREG